MGVRLENESVYLADPHEYATSRRGAICVWSLECGAAAPFLTLRGGATLCDRTPRKMKMTTSLLFREFMLT